MRHRHGQAAHPDAQQAVAQQTVAQQTALPTEGLRYRAQNLERATAHVVTVPPAYKVTVAIADETTDALTPVAAIAQSQGAIAALNAGFFDPQNGQTTSYITIDGELIADPRDNGRLMDNPDLLPYREQILNRSEFRRYRCSGLDREDSHFRYGIAPHSSPPPCGCHIVDVVGGGPSLLPLTSEAEGFVAEVDGARIRDALGETQPNARSAVGITPEGEVLLVAVEQRPELDRSGVSLPELADLMRSLGAQTALNLDGGSSTTLYYQGQTYAGRWVEGAPVERPVKSALVVMDGATAAP
ncbi:MAG: phosphodiester glycosidase family protein [Cyanobacteria bacterium P01_A01_bin.135]